MPRAYRPRLRLFPCGSVARPKAALRVARTPEDVIETLVRLTDDAHTINRESKTDTGWESSGEVSILRRDAAKPAPDDGSAPKVEDLGTEKVTVEGKAYDCKKSRTTFGDTVTTTWT